MSEINKNPSVTSLISLQSSFSRCSEGRRHLPVYLLFIFINHRTRYIWRNRTFPARFTGLGCGPNLFLILSYFRTVHRIIFLVHVERWKVKTAGYSLILLLIFFFLLFEKLNMYVGILWHFIDGIRPDPVSTWRAPYYGVYYLESAS